MCYIDCIDNTIKNMFIVGFMICYGTWTQGHVYSIPYRPISMSVYMLY